MSSSTSTPAESTALTKVATWLRQPTSVVGLATIAGAIAGVASKTISISDAVPVGIGGLTMLAIPDNTHASADAVTLAKAALTAVTSKSLGSVATVADDAVTLANDVSPSAAVALKSTAEALIGESAGVSAPVAEAVAQAVETAAPTAAPIVSEMAKVTNAVEAVTKAA